jgi:hypothetical protein
MQSSTRLLSDRKSVKCKRGNKNVDEMNESLQELCELLVEFELVLHCC